RRTLVAVTDGQIVGAASLESMRQRRAHVGQVGVMVHDDYTRRGIGSRLMTAILDIADNWLNLHRLELQVYTHNQEAIHLYQRFGFEIEGTLRDYAYGEGRYLDAYTMARLRSTPA
ncbi:MAG: GNAT family N-acetyltransferase, partial [Chloroflexi bacterium]|nr:GNAT family N-acetyltransferase [Chloroflexota bacterium]